MWVDLVRGCRNSTSRPTTRPRSFVLVFAQIFLVLKKKQFENVQVSEMNF
ncbi:hypothetical protein ES288_D13G167700v1 [Gossypium darwinii]|uniref:Uncharacterized protein n=1 Tax=Gossypium darwinii TaxID=34276 RepID=A0A5D1ZYT7_GOSDA|nr:hypothetical protein ES288_D13G167700v1 [Gossypium darwinii]